MSGRHWGGLLVGLIVLTGCTTAGTPVAEPVIMLSESAVRDVLADLPVDFWLPDDIITQERDPGALLTENRDQWDDGSGGPEFCFPYYVRSQLVDPDDRRGSADEVVVLSEWWAENDYENIIVTVRVNQMPRSGPSFVDRVKQSQQTCGTTYRAHEGWSVTQMSLAAPPSGIPAAVTSQSVMEVSPDYTYRATYLARENVVMVVESYQIEGGELGTTQIDDFVVELAQLFGGAVNT